MRRLAVACLVLATSCSAATKFVNHSAAGSNNGTSWANGWTNVSGITGLSAGDVVCIAGGTYSGTINTASSGSAGNPITYRRATAADATCGSSTSGWSGAFDAQVVIAGIGINNNYVTIDGAVANGITMVVANGANNAIGVSGPTDHITLRYVETNGPCTSTACAQTSDSRSVDLTSWSGTAWYAQTNWLIQYGNFHGSCTNLITYNSTNLIIEHSRFADSATVGTTFCHPNVLESGGDVNATFRYNEVTNWQVEGLMVCPNGGCTANWAMYGNIFHDPMAGSTPRVIEAQGNANGPHLLYNNTFVNLYNICSSTANGGSFASGTQGRNNLFYGNNFANTGLPSDDYDYSDKSLAGEAHGQGSAANPFTNYAGGVFTLTSNTTAGLNLGSPYDTDYVGNARTTWSRGAYEFGGAPASPAPALSGSFFALLSTAQSEHQGAH